MRSNRLLFVRPTFCHHKRQEDVGDSIETIHIFLNWEKTKLLKISLAVSPEVLPAAYIFILLCPCY